MAEEEYEVEKIIDVKKRKNKPLYLIRWKGYGPDEDSWEPAENLTNCEDMLKTFNETHPIKKSPSTTSTKKTTPPRKPSRIDNSVDDDTASFCNGMTTSSSHSAVAELVRSSLDISPLHLKEKVGRYPTISEIRYYAAQKSLAKLNGDDETDESDDTSSTTNSSPKSFGYYVFVTAIVAIFLGVIWALLIWALNLQSTVE